MDNIINLNNVNLSKFLSDYLNTIPFNDVDTLCRPLKLLHINYFLYVKRTSDKLQIELTNDPFWYKYFYTNLHYLNACFENVSFDYKAGLYLWSELGSDKLFHDMKHIRNIVNGATLIKSYSDCTEFYHFGSNELTPLSEGIYIEYQDLLERFILYFKSESSALVKFANKFKIKMPNKNQQMVSAYNKESITNIFKELTPIRRYYISDKSSDLYLTRKELSVLKYFSLGNTAKQTAKLMNISPRTVEDHILHAKEKISSARKINLNSTLIKLLE